MAVIALMAAVIICFGVSTGFAMHSAETGLNGVIQLDMAPDSVDDTYDGCKEQMKSKVLKEFLENEKNRDVNFKKAWEMAWKQKEKPHSIALGREQAVAINVYTRETPKVYLDFNQAVRTQKSEYKTTFKYHTLHFFLTDALQTLSAKSSNAEKCLTVYRRTKCNFSQDVLNKEIRFGSFTSSSLGDYPSSVKFGDKSCFKIVTCFGADITEYSVLNGHEREVLIPPYEVFKVTAIQMRSKQEDLPCEVVYTVKSTRKTSNTNCAFFPKGSLPNIR